MFVFTLHRWTHREAKIAPECSTGLPGPHGALASPQTAHPPRPRPPSRPAVILSEVEESHARARSPIACLGPRPPHLLMRSFDFPMGMNLVFIPTKQLRLLDAAARCGCSMRLLA